MPRLSEEPERPTHPAARVHPPSYVQSVDRAVALLRAVASASGRQSTAAALAEACDLNRATAWRILTTLESTGMVWCDRDTGRWSIGLGVLELAGRRGLQGLIDAAHSVLVRLCDASGETADLAVVRAEGLTYVDEVAPSSIVTAKWLGRSVPLHATSTGKALLAFLPVREVERLLPRHLVAHTPNTITQRSLLMAELELTKARGYGVCRGELESTLWGVSAPALDPSGRPIAVVSIWGPSERVTEGSFAALGALAISAGHDMARLRVDRMG